MKALEAVKKTGGTYVTVTDDEILAAIALLGKLEGIFGEPAGVTGVAGILKAMNLGIIEPTQTVATIITGNGLKDVKNGMKAAREPMKIKPELSSVIKYFE